MCFSFCPESCTCCDFYMNLFKPRLCVHLTATHYCFSVCMQVVCIILIFLSPSQIFFFLFYYVVNDLGWQITLHCFDGAFVQIYSFPSYEHSTVCPVLYASSITAVSMPYAFLSLERTCHLFPSYLCFFFHIICFPFLPLNPGRCVPVPSSSYLSSISVHYFLLLSLFSFLPFPTTVSLTVIFFFYFPFLLFFYTLSSLPVLKSIPCFFLNN